MKGKHEHLQAPAKGREHDAALRYGGKVCLFPVICGRSWQE